MEKYSITVSTQADACYINKMIENRSQWDKEPIFDGYPLHVGVNYTSDPFVRRCVEEDGGWAGIRIEPVSKKFNLRNELSKFRFVDGFSVFLEEESEYYTLTLYYQNTELVSITFDDGLKDPGKKYMVYVNQPYYENGKSTFVVRQKETDKQYIFLETGSAKVAFNMVNRIVSGMRYPKAKKIW